MSTLLPRCQDCGACCIAEQDQHYHAELSDQEADRGVFGPGGRYERHVVSTRDYGDDSFGISTHWRDVADGPLAAFRVCACCFLDGSPLVRVACRIYPDRPHVCRDFRPGSPRCLAAIQWLQDQTDE